MGGGISALLTSEKKCLNFGKHFYDLNSVVHTYPSSALDLRSWSRGFPFEMRSRRQGTCACIEIAKMGHSWNVTANYYSNMSTLQSGGGGQWHKMEKMENYPRVFPFSP